MSWKPEPTPSQLHVHSLSYFLFNPLNCNSQLLVTYHTECSMLMFTRFKSFTHGLDIPTHQQCSNVSFVCFNIFSRSPSNKTATLRCVSILSFFVQIHKKKMRRNHAELSGSPRDSAGRQYTVNLQRERHASQLGSTDLPRLLQRGAPGEADPYGSEKLP